MSDVRVGIVSWNTAALLDRCLEALPAALGGMAAEVVVVDNASGDASVEMAARHAGVEVAANPLNVGYARAMNRALAGTGAPVLIALNPDTEPPPGSLATLVQRLLGRPDVALVVPRLCHPDGTLAHSVYRFPSVALAATVCFVPPSRQRGAAGRRWWLEGAAPHDRATDIDWAIGAVHVIRASAVAGGPTYSERWFMYVEDLDLCWRLARQGWRRRLEADVEVVHVGNAAGSKAWGDGRERLWWSASYDWYAQVHGRPAARRWAAANSAGALLHEVATSIGGLSPGPAGARRRAAARGLVRVLPVHLQAMVNRAPPVQAEAMVDLAPPQGRA